MKQQMEEIGATIREYYAYSHCKLNTKQLALATFVFRADLLLPLL